MKNPLLAPMVAMAAGILSAHFVRFNMPELAYALGASAILIAVSLFAATKRMAIACALLLVFFTGIWRAEKYRIGDPPLLNAESNEVLLLAGCVVEPLTTDEERAHFTLELGPHARVRVTVPLREGVPLPRLPYGTKLEVPAKIRIPHNFHNPGSFDYVTFLARQYIYWTASAHDASVISVIHGPCGSPFWSVLYRIRVASLERIENFYQGDTYTTGMMEAMLLGESSKLQKVWTEHFRRTGTYHALVISGLHVTVLAASLLFVLRLCFVPRLQALLIADAAAWLYALISGWQAPVVRSAGGFTLFLIARLFYRQGRLLNLLGAVALAFLFLDPDQMYDASFQLSFLSVATIGALAAPLIDKTSGPRAAALRDLADADRDLHFVPAMAQFRIEVRLISEALSLAIRVPLKWTAAGLSLSLRAIYYVYEMMVISTTIQIGLALPMILYFHRMSFTGLTANVLVVPVLSAAVPVGFLAIITNWRLPAALAKWFLVISQRVVDWHARYETHWRVLDPPLWLALAFVAALLLLAFTLHSRNWLRVGSLAAVACLFILLCWSPFVVSAHQNEFELTAIDVGQGDSLLLRFPNGQTMLIDAGGFPSFGRRVKSNLDIGEDVVSPYLWQRGIRSLDVLAFTHAHEDHIGGLHAVMENFRPKALWTGANSPESVAWKAIKDQADALGVKTVPLHEGQAFAFGGTQIEVLAPLTDYRALAIPKNNDSLVLKITYGSNTFLLTGDMEKQVESRLLAEGRLGKIDVLKVGHHGSRTSSIDGFVEAIHPTFALISVGLDNSYHHPTADVIERLTNAHSAVLRTDQFGLVSLRSDGHRLQLDTFRWSLQQGEGWNLPFSMPF